MKTSLAIPATTLAAGAIVLGACTSLSYQDRGENDVKPDPLPGAAAPDFGKYRSPLNATVVDRRFNTREAMFLANEMNMGGFPFFEQALVDGLVESDPDFQYMTTVESYWYSRYNMSALVAESRLGVHVVYGPYVTDWALREGRGNVNRDRGEYVRSNKGALLQEIIPMYRARTGFPRRFEDGSPTMLEFASGDPHLVRPLDKGTSFESTENLLRSEDLQKVHGTAVARPPFGMGVAGNDMWKFRINYRENFLSLRWDHEKMDRTCDLGAEGQTLMKMVLWMEYFFRGSHHRGAFLGNDPEEGFRACMLNLMAVNKMLMLKSAMLCDGKQLLGIDPREAVAGAQYFPHRVGIRMRMIGDLPPRPEEFEISDDSSQLFDQASLLWGLTEYYHFADPSFKSNWNKVFGENPPYDGSVMEQKYIALAEGLANLILHNLEAMHQGPGGALVSEWHPDSGPGSTVSTPDLAMAMIALANFARRIHVEPDDVRLSREMLERQAGFLVDKLQTADGSVADGFDFGSGTASQAPRTLLAQGMAIRGLLEAYDLLEDEIFLESAKKAYGFMNDRLWGEEAGIYRSHAGAQVSEYTPMNLGSALGAMRGMILVTKNKDELERYKRFWVQAVDSSGIQQSEYEETGERDFFAKDGDGDGIPRMEYGDGKYGIAAVYASRVSIQTPSRLAKR